MNIAEEKSQVVVEEPTEQLEKEVVSSNVVYVTFFEGNPAFGKKQMTLLAAEELAAVNELTLVQIGDKAYRIIDPAKEAYRKKKEKNQKTLPEKIIKIGVNIFKDDFDRKIHQAKEFAKKGHVVKVICKKEKYDKTDRIEVRLSEFTSKSNLRVISQAPGECTLKAK